MKTSSVVTLNDEQFADMMDVSLLKKADTSSVSAAVQTIISSSITKSDKIRQLLATGMKRGEVAKLLEIKYQHVRNVELMPLKRK